MYFYSGNNRKRLVLLGTDLNAAFSGAVFLYDNLIIDLASQFRHVGYDSDKAVIVGETLKRAHSLPERVIIQRPEAFVHEHGIQADSSGCFHDFFRKPEGKRERGKKRFAAGQSFDAPLRSVEMIKYV